MCIAQQPQAHSLIKTEWEDIPGWVMHDTSDMERPYKGRD